MLPSPPHIVAVRQQMPHSLSPELRWLFRKIRPQLYLHTASFVCLTLASVAALITPLSIRWLIDSILPNHYSHLLVAAIGLVFASYEGRAVLNALGGYLTFRASQSAALDLRMCLLRHLDSLSADYSDRTPVGEMLYPFSSPIDAISYFGSDLLPSVLRTIVAAGITLSAMVVLSPFLTLAVVPLVPVFLSIRYHYRNRITREADAVQSDQAMFSSFLQEHLSALTQLQLLRQTEAQEGTAHQLLTKAVCSQDTLCRTGVSFSAFSNLTIVTGLAAILGCGSLLVLSGNLTVGTLVAFYSLLIQLFDPLSSVAEMYSRAQRTFASIRQVRTVLELVPSIREHPNASALRQNIPFNIELRDVHFGYPEPRNLIHIPRLEIFHGQRVAVVGPNGAGKSTLAKLLARIYDVKSGAILIAGSDIRAIRLPSLRSSVCYLPSQPVLFHQSVANNLRIGRPEATNDQLREALQIVGLQRFLQNHRSGLDQLVGPGGSTLSTGERQRLAIARTLLQCPPILILDETTSSLDPSFEEVLFRAVSERMPKSTLIIVSHRLHSLSWVERILVLENGQVVGDGGHSFLSAMNPLYAKLLASTVSAA
jgi:ABC-type multidrug transport system fused ATPase/permease subunit